MPQYTFEFSNGLDKSFSELCASKGLSRADTLRRAIASYGYLSKQIAAGMKVVLTDNNGSFIKDVELP